MDTTNKHYGNILSKLSDKDIKEVIEQWAIRTNRYGRGWEMSMITMINDILNCNNFDSYGNCKLEYDEFDYDKMNI